MASKKYAVQVKGDPPNFPMYEDRSAADRARELQQPVYGECEIVEYDVTYSQRETADGFEVTTVAKRVVT